MEKSFDDIIKSDNGKKFLETLHQKFEQQKGRYRKFEKYIETHNFVELLHRLILEHNDKYIEKCINNGSEPHPNNKLEFIIQYLSENTPEIEIDELNCNFLTEIHEFKNYYFQIIWGQGCVTKIYNKKDLKLLLSL
jgi:hypothetical protein